MIWFACLLKNSNHLICNNIKNVVFFRKILTFVHLSFINHELSFIFCLQSIRRHRLIKIWKVRIRKVFSNLCLRKWFVLFCLKNRFSHYTKIQTFFTSRCNQNFQQNFHFCDQNSHLHDFDLRFRLRFRRFFDFRFQITFVAFVSIISIFAMIHWIIYVSVNDIFKIVDRWKKYEKNNRFETKFAKKKNSVTNVFWKHCRKIERNTWLKFDFRKFYTLISIFICTYFFSSFRIFV